MRVNGARHQREQGVFLGNFIDVEPDGQPTITALGDDNNPSPTIDDEDGVKFLTPLVQGGTATVQVVAYPAGKLDAWIDFDDERRAVLVEGDQYLLAVRA